MDGADDQQCSYRLRIEIIGGESYSPPILHVEEGTERQQDG